MAQVAIEYGARRLRLVEFEGSVRNLRVTNVVDVDLFVPDTGDDEFDPDDTRTERIVDAAKEAGVTRDPSGMALAASHALFREFDLPFTADEQIHKVVRFEAESHLPVSIEDVVVQHVVERKTRDKSHLLVAAVEKDFLLDRFDMLAEAGFDPMFVDLDVFALFHALAGTGVTAEHERFAVFDVQEATTSLIVVHDGQLHATRSIRVGTHSVSAAAADEATDEHERDVMEARTHAFLQRLEREIRRTTTSLPGARDLECVYVTGSGGRVEGFAEMVGRVMAAEVETLDLLERVDHRLDDDDVARYGPDIGVALGVAYRLNGLDLTGTDFRREECRYTKKFDQVKVPLVMLSFLVAGMMFFFGLEQHLETRRLEGEYGRILAIAEDQLEATLGDVEEAERIYGSAEVGPQRVDRIARAMQGVKADLQTELGRGGRIPQLASALNVWIHLFDLIRDHEDRLLPLRIESLDIDVYSRNPELKLTALMRDRTSVQEFVSLLKEHPVFSEVNEPRTREVGGDTRVDGLIVPLDLDALAAIESRGEEGAE